MPPSQLRQFRKGERLPDVIIRPPQKDNSVGRQRTTAFLGRPTALHLSKFSLITSHFPPARHKSIFFGLRASGERFAGGCRSDRWRREPCLAAGGRQAGLFPADARLPGSARDVSRDDVGGVPVQAAAGPVVPHRGSRIAMRGGFLHVAQRDPGVQSGSGALKASLTQSKSGTLRDGGLSAGRPMRLS
jgi:hypothetical protein